MDATPFIRSSHYRVVKVLKTPVHSIQGSQGIKAVAVLWQGQIEDVDVNPEL